jgi:predicted negative regulator of RcsB-dependent stress response
MTDQPQEAESSNSVTNVSGGVNAKAEQINVGADVVGRDKTISAGTYIEHYHAGGEAALSRPKVYHNLPQPDYTRFIGRDRELAWLRERLSPRDRVWQMAIMGIGGIGKSALALTIAREYLERRDELPQEERFEAIIWISAKEQVLTTQGRDQAAPAGLILRSLEDVYAAIAQTLDREDITRETTSNERDRLVQKVLSEYRTLLVMDNLESVTDERIQPFLRYLPGQTKAVITSREWVEVADTLALRGLTSEEAERLLEEEAAVRKVTFNVSQGQRLVDLTSGLPLPLKLGVARIAGGESFEAVTRWLGNAVGDVPEYCVQGQAELARQRNPNAWSLLLAVSLCDRDAGAAREALGEIVDLSIADRDNGLAQLQRLFLINRTDSDRFWALPIVQRYAAAQFVEVDLANMPIERWLTWLSDYAQTYGKDLEFHIENLAKVRDEYPNLSLAIKWCVEHRQWDTFLQLVEGTWFFAYVTGLINESWQLLEAALTAATQTKDERPKGRIHLNLARVALGQGNKDEVALEQLRRAEAIARQYNDEVELGWIWEHMSNVHGFLQSGIDQAMELAQSALEVGKRHNDNRLQSVAALRLASFERKRKNYEIAWEWLDRAESYARAIGWSRHLAWISHARSGILFDQGNFAAAEALYSQELELREAWGDRRFIGYIKQHLAQIYAATGRVQAARQAAEETRVLFDKLGMPRFVARSEDLLRELEGSG